MQNAIEHINGLPKFSEIRPSQIVETITKAINLCKQAIEQTVSDGQISYQNVVMRLEEADDNLSKMWSPISHMNAVVSSDELRNAHDACLPLLSEYSTWVGQHQALYQLYAKLEKSKEFSKLSVAQQKVVKNAVRDFSLSGVALSKEKKGRFAEIKSRLSELSSAFSNNVMDATMAWSKLVIQQDELNGLPDSVVAAAKQLATDKNQKGWLFTLDIPSYLPVMMYADSASFRQEMYEAYTTRASERGPLAAKFDNSSIIDETLKLKQELAEMLDFENYAQLSLATKMASSPSDVMDFLDALASKSLPQAKLEVKELREFALIEFGITNLEAWDYAYYSEKLKQKKYAISDEQLRPYFPESRVISGMFEVTSRLYGLTIKQDVDVDTWHQDVKFYNIFDSQQSLRGSFYLDLYAREKKRGGAWMDECRVRRVRKNGDLQLPVAYLTCNFNGPIDDKPALFTHDEVVTLFHEFGHGLHHMLTKVDEGAVSGINGVPWDAVELPSQFLENWCWQSEALNFISGHHETGEPLPNDMLEKMLAAKNFQSAMQMVRQLEFSIFDFKLHMNRDESLSVQEVLDEVRKEVAVVMPPNFNRFQNSFGHIFAGGYAAGYYSYKWAEVLSSDAFERFEEEGIFNPKTGQAFLNDILEKGGTIEPMALFIAFRGREPKVDALLRHSGITGAAA